MKIDKLMNLEQYIEKISQEDPSFSYKKVVFFEDGWNHDVLLFDNKRIFRFLKWSGSIKNEHDLLDYLQKYISCRIPLSLYLSESETWNEESYISWKKLKEISNDKVWNVLTSIALFLRELHNIPRENLKWIGYERDDDNSWYVRHMKEQTTLYLAEYISEKLKDDIFLFIEVAFGYVHPNPCLIHWDINGKNIFRDDSLETWKKLWVIDFDDATIFDPAKDFCHFWRKYWSEVLEKMLGVYGEVDESFRDRIDMHYKRARLYVCIDHIVKNRKRTPKEVAKELEDLFSIASM